MTEKTQTRKLAAILAADVAGYSRLMAEDESATVAALNAARAVVRERIEQHDGQLIDTSGDSVLAEFRSVVEAVQCAVEIQETLKERNEPLPADRRMLFRIGVNLGDIIEQDDGTIYGNGVNVAARLEGLAEPGGINISDDAYRQVMRTLSLGFQDIGEHEVKNIPEPVRVYRVLPEGAEILAKPASPRKSGPGRKTPILAAISAVVLIAVAAIVWVVAGDSRTKVAERPADAGEPSIAVLPFDNMSGDSGQDYFADGMTEAIITELSRVPDLLVIARNSSFAYKGKAVNIADIAAALGVRYIMEGSVQKAGDRVRITAQLIDAETGGHIWADKFDRALVDIFDLQDEVTNEIVAALEMTLGPDDARADSKPLTGNMDAYDSYLQGVDLFHNTTRENNLESRRLFDAAITLDPGFAAAHAALSWTYFRGWVLQWEPGPETFARARELALKAVEIDPGLPNAHEILASIYLWQKQHDKARQAAETAIKVGPNSANAYRTLADIHNYSGNPTAAIEAVEQARRRNPNDAWLHGWDTRICCSANSTRRWQCSRSVLPAIRTSSPLTPIWASLTTNSVAMTRHGRQRRKPSKSARDSRSSASPSDCPTATPGYSTG